MMNSKVTLENYMKQFLLENNKKFSKNTAVAYKTNLNQYLDFYDEKYSDLENLINYKTYLEKHYQPVTIRNKLSTLRVYFKYLEKNKLIDISPFKQIVLELPVEETKMHVLTDETLKLLEDHMIKKSYTANRYHKKLAIRNHAIIELILSTGIRLSELCGLKKDDIDFSKKEIVIGNRRKRILTISTKCAFLIKSYLNMEENESIYLFSLYGKRISERTVQHFLEKISKELNIDEKINPNSLRQKYISNLLNTENFDLITAKEKIGININNVYRYYESFKMR